MNKTVIAFAAGVATAVVVWGALETSWHVSRLPDASDKASSLALERYETPEADIKSGAPNFRAAAYSLSSDGKTLSGVWSAEGPSRFDWSYSSDEAVYIQEGGVEIEYLGRQFKLNPGDTAFFHAGTKATWSVPQHVRKTWTIHQTSSFVRWFRNVKSTLGMA